MFLTLCKWLPLKQLYAGAERRKSGHNFLYSNWIILENSCGLWRDRQSRDRQSQLWLRKCHSASSEASPLTCSDLGIWSIQVYRKSKLWLCRSASRPHALPLKWNDNVIASFCHNEEPEFKFIRGVHLSSPHRVITCETNCMVNDRFQVSRRTH